jgi:hypothetical protein
VDIQDIYFEAAAGTGPLTRGQRAIWRGLVAIGPESHRFNFHGVLGIPPGRSMETVADAIRELVRRHPGLRTLFPRFPEQHVAERGAIRLSTHEAATEDAAEVASGLVQQLSGLNFRPEDEWPVRFALVHSGGVPRQLVIVLSHLVVDVHSLRVVLDDLGKLLAGQALAPDETTWGPLELAAHERGTEGQAEQAASLRHWRAEALAVPSTIFDFPRQAPEANRLCGLRMSSSAVAVAATWIAKAGRCSTSAVILAAVSAVLGHYTGHRRFSLELIASNRWRPEVARTVATMNNNGLLSVAIDGAVPFGEFARTTWRQSLQGYRSAAYDPSALEETTHSIKLERGVHVHHDVLFNDIRPVDGWPDLPEVTTPAALSDLLAATTVDQSGEWATALQRLCVNVFETRGRATIDFEFDTAYFPVARGRGMLRGIEMLLVCAAQRRVLLREVGDITGIVPATRGEAWRWISHVDGWVWLADLEQAIAAAAGGVRCGVFLERDDPDAIDDGAPAERLVAYLGPGGADLSPEQLHEEVCARLRNLYGPVAPDHYVFCRAAPADGSQAGWRAQPVRFSGSGRARR